MTRPPLPRRDRRVRRDQTRGAHRRPRHVLADLPTHMPGALVAAFGLARRSTAAGAVALLAMIAPGWLTDQAADSVADTAPGHSAPDPEGAS